MHRRQAAAAKLAADSQGTSRSRPPSSSQNRKAQAESKQRAATPNLPASARESAIQVYVRCAPPSSESPEANCITCEPTKGTELILSSGPANTSPTAFFLGSTTQAEEQKLYTYDSCFGGHADQAMVYAEVCQPLLDKVLEGYPCTIFAYGATGTGKTYTMQGDLAPSLTGNYSPSAGLIPRVLYRLFDRLEGKEFSVKISYLELYNEELRDLNASTSSPPEPKIFDDASKRGVVVHNIEESHVVNAQQGLKVLHRGAARRQVAATDCNEQSSRSHTVFTITVSVTTQGGSAGSTEESVKVGKLSLVDVAGSENVGKSGAGRSDGRAREAGMINQSLLTLGRVINALVEKSSHIPYRESKLTRLLQDSLGGRTQTCIIATVSPALSSYEETQSTLDYALRAKSITNRPESNARLTRHALLNTYAAEIERLRLDLAACREKTGIYLSNESWEELNASQERKRVELDLSKRQVETLDMNLRTMSEQFEHSLKLLTVKEADIRSLTEAKELAEEQIGRLQGDIRTLREKLDKRKVQLASSEQQRKDWKRWASEAIADADGLRAKIDRKTKNDTVNVTSLANVQQVVTALTSKLNADLNEIATARQSYLNNTKTSLSKLTEDLTKLVQQNQVAAKEAVAQMSSRHDSTMESMQRLDGGCQELQILFEDAQSSMRSIVQSAFDDLEKDQTSFSQQMQTRCANHAIELDRSTVRLVRETTQRTEEARQWQAEREDLLQALHNDRKSELEEENARLQAQNQHLATLLETTQKNQTAFQQSFLSSVSQQLANFSSGQTRLLRDGFGRTERELTGISERRSSHLNKSLYEHEAFHRKDSQHLTTLLDCTDIMREDAEVGAQGFKNTLQEIGKDLDVPISLASTSAAAVSERLCLGGKTLAAGASKHFDELSSQVRTCRQNSVDMTESGSRNILGLLSQLSHTSGALENYRRENEEASDFHANHHQELLSGCSRYATDISSHLTSNLRLQEDPPTGQTPRKRSWPSAEHSVQQRPSKKSRREAEVGTSSITPPGSPVKQLSNVSPNKIKQSAIKVFSDKRHAMNALDAVIDANLLKPEKAQSAPFTKELQQPPSVPNIRSQRSPRSPIKSMR